MVKQDPHQNAKRELLFLQQALGLRSDDPNPRLRDPVILCIDCEAYERDHSCVTEIGIAILDTKDLRRVDPGEEGEQWFGKIKAAHLRPIEYERLVNRQFVKGREEYFNFGKTTWISLQDITKVLHRVCSSPADLHHAADVDKELPNNSPDVVFAAHAISNESKYLGQLGFPLNGQGGVDAFIKSIDSQLLAGGTKKNKPSLSRLLHALNIDAVNLHNGGNDAVYTLQAIVRMAVMDYEKPGSVFSAIQQAGSGKLAPSVNTSERTEHVYAGTSRQHLEHREVSDGPAPASHGVREVTVVASSEDTPSHLPTPGRNRPAEDINTEADPSPNRMAVERSG